MAHIDVDALLTPVSDAQPCGPDLEYDSDFLALEEAARGKPEQQFGDTIIPAEDPDWRRVQQLSSDLFERTKDLRVAVHLLRASTRLQGLGAAAQGLQLIQALLSSQWDHVHPMLDVDDGNDPTMRLNALAPLVDAQCFLADIRKANASSGRASITGRDIELASGKVQPYDGESVIPMSGIAQALREAEAQQPGALATLAGMAETVSSIDAVISEKASISGPEFRPLRLLLQTISDAARQVVAESGGAPEASNDTDPAAAVHVGGDATATFGAAAHMPVTIASAMVRNRDDALLALDKVCQWIEANEPSHPAPLFIRRAQRLMSMGFLDIIRDLVPDGIDQVNKLAGVPSDSY